MGNNCSNKRTSYKDVCWGIFIAILIIIATWCIYCVSPCYWHLNEYGDFIGGISAIVSITLLYITLKNQDRSFKQERFETTFFNLLETHKKLTEELTVSQIVPKDYVETVKPQEFKGRQCFCFASIERFAICRALAAERYEGYYDSSDEDDAKQWYYEMDYYINEPEKLEHCEKMMTKIEEENGRKYYNLLYKISKETYEKYHEDIKKRDTPQNIEKASSICQEIFYSSYYFIFEGYLRSLEQLIKFICINKPNNESGRQYMEILTSQMSRYELRFVICHALRNSNFQQILNETGMYDILKEKDFAKN